jgi:hypothetical protein
MISTRLQRKVVNNTTNGKGILSQSCKNKISVYHEQFYINEF